MRRICKYAAVIIAVMSFAATESQGQLVSLSEPGLDFGNVALGDSETDIVTVTNIAGEDIFFTATVSGTGFSTTSFGSPTLSPGESADVAVQFSPTLAGNAAGSVLIEVFAVSSNEDVTVDLVGTGGASDDPCVLVDDILDFFDASIANGTLESAGYSNRRLRAMRCRIKAISFLCQHGYLEYAAYITHTAILRSDGDPCPRDFVQGTSVDSLNDQLIVVEQLLLAIAGCE